MPINLTCVYNVAEGLEVSYEIIRSEVSANIEGTKIKGNGFVLEGHVFECKEIVTTEVVSVSDFSVSWKIKKSDYSETYYITSLGYYNKYIDFLSASLNAAMDLTNEWEETQYRFGYGLPLFPFIDPSEDTWNYLSNIGTYMSNTIGNLTTTGINIDYSFDFWEESATVYLEGFSGGIINGVLFSEDFDVTYESLILTSYEKSTGILNGMRIAGFCQGTINSIEVDLIINYYCQRLGYSLPPFQYGTKDYDTKESSWIFLVICFPVFIIFTIQKKYKRK